MKFSCERAILQTAVNAASRVVTARSSISALEGLLIETSETTVSVAGYNMATGIRSVFSVSQAEPGSVIINARLLGDIVRKSPDDWITISVDDNMSVSIVCGMSKYNIMGLPSDEFPSLPETESDNRMNIEQKRLKSIISRTIFAVSDNESKPIHTGELFDFDNGVLSVVAVDGYRLAVCKEEVDASSSSMSFVVPSAALKEVERLCDETDNYVEISLGRRHITFEIGDIVVISRLLEGEFLNYKSALPSQSKYEIKAKTQDLKNSVDRVSLIINERLKNPMRCEFGDGELRISCQTSLGNAADIVAIEGNGEDLTIGFNYRFLQDALRSVPDDEVIIKLNSGLSPCLITPIEGDSYTFMVLPVRLR